MWGEHALRRYRAAIVPDAGASRRGCGRRVTGASRRDRGSNLGPALGSLRWVAQSGGIDAERLPQTLDRAAARRRRNAEAAAAARKRKRVQHLCQSHGVLPWMRDALPLVFAGDALDRRRPISGWTRAGARPPDAPGFGCAWDERADLVDRLTWIVAGARDLLT